MGRTINDDSCDWRVIANTNWDLRNPRHSETIRAACLKGIYEELKTLNRIMGCGNTLAIPEILRGIRKNTAKPKKKPAKKGR